MKPTLNIGDLVWVEYTHKTGLIVAKRIRQIGPDRFEGRAWRVLEYYVQYDWGCVWVDEAIATESFEVISGP